MTSKQILPDFIQSLCDIWTQEVLNETAIDPSKDLLSPAQKAEQIKLQIANLINTYMDSLEKGLMTLSHTLKNLSFEKTQEFPEAIWNEIIRIRETPTPSLDELQNENLSLKEFYKISDETLSYFYQVANDLFQKQQYLEAKDILTYLCALDAENKIYWLALGNTEYYLQDFNKALQAYTAAILTSPEDPRAFLYAAHCYAHLGEIKSAKEYANCAQEIASLFPDEAELKESAQHYCEKLKRVA